MDGHLTDNDSALGSVEKIQCLAILVRVQDGRRSVPNIDLLLFLSADIADKWFPQKVRDIEKIVQAGLLRPDYYRLRTHCRQVTSEAR